MAGRHYDHDRVCCCDQADANCAGLAVRRLSQERVRELAEEIWTASTGSTLPVRALRDPCSSHPGASARAAYRRQRQQEREAWRPGRTWRAVAVATAAVGGGLAAGLAMGAWLGSVTAVLVTLLAGWRLRFRPSASARVWRRQAASQRRTAGLLRPLESEGYLVLHDITLPGWSASLDHLVVGPTGVWVIESWQRTRPTLPRKDTRARGAADPLHGLRWHAAAVAEALAGGASVPVRPLLCVHGSRWPAGPRSIQEVQVAFPRQLADAVHHGSQVQLGDIEWATARLLELFRPAV